MDGLQELPLVLPDLGVVDLLEQLGVLVDEPRLPEHVGRGVLDLKEKQIKRVAPGLVPSSPIRRFPVCGYPLS